ncbi:MAG: butyrate kinase [Gemmatimonadota bacterium]
MSQLVPTILALNPGAASTKLGLFDGDSERFVSVVEHPETLTSQPVLAQLEPRLEAVQAELERQGVDPAGLTAVAGRGGLLRPVPSGTFRVGPAMLDDLRSAARGEHASNLGAFLAVRLAEAAGAPAYVVDPVSVDEWDEVARLSGLHGLERTCLSHALNTKAVARRHAREVDRAYAELRLVVVHMGSGISVSAHREARMVEVCNSREEGPFGADRAGGLPVAALLDRIRRGQEDAADLYRRATHRGGLLSYMGTRDVREVLRRIERGSRRARLVLDAMLYQVRREAGAMAAVLDGRVHAVLLTGGMVQAAAVAEELRERLAWIAPVHVYPGEDELRALAEGALRVVRGEEEALSYEPALTAE